MNVDDLLRERGDQWQTPDVDGPDLGAAIGRSARRNRVARVAVAAVAVLAVGGTAWAVLPVRRDIPAIPAPAVTPTASATAVRRVIAVPDSDTSAALAGVAKVLEGDFIKVPANGELKSSTAIVVGSTVAAAAGTLTLPPGADPAQPVWVLQMESRFGCGPCTAPEDRGTIRPVLRALVTQDDLEVIATGTFTAKTDLGALGTPTALDLTRDPGWNVLRDSVKRNLAAIDKARLDSDRSVQTTLWRVQKRLRGQAPEPPSFRDVWVVRLKGAFTCSTCTQFNGSSTGPVLVLVIDAVNGDLIESLIAGQSFDMGPLAGQRSMIFAPSSVR
jgi:hypothetical protein